MIDKILKSVDKNSKKESLAVLATLVDWKQAFPRQCPKLGVKSFIKNGVRPALIPLLINYFQSRKMKVKWHGEVSEVRELKGVDLKVQPLEYGSILVSPMIMLTASVRMRDSSLLMIYHFWRSSTCLVWG